MLALAGDPVIDDGQVARHMMPGKEKTVEGENIDGVTKVFIGGKECSNVSVANGQLTFTLPAMEEGDYQMAVEKNDGMKYGCGKVTVSNEEFIPVYTETTVWKGHEAINWGDHNVQIAEALADVRAGQTVKVYFSIQDEAEYHCMRITNNDWSADYLPQVDNIQDNADGYCAVKMTQEMVDRLATGFLITGFGYYAEKVTVE